jgi:hypothetical protein
MAAHGIQPGGNAKALALCEALLADRRIAWADEPADFDAPRRTDRNRSGGVC